MSKKVYFSAKGKNVNYGLKYDSDNSGYTHLAEKLADKYDLELRGFSKLKSFFSNNYSAADYIDETLNNLFEIARINKISKTEIIKIIYNFLNKNILPTPELLKKKLELLSLNKDNTIEGALWNPYLFSNVISIELLEILMLLSIKADGKVVLTDIDKLIKSGISTDANEVLAKIGILFKLKINPKEIIKCGDIFKDSISVETLNLIASQLLLMKDTQITIERVLDIASLMKEDVESNRVEGSFKIPLNLKMLIFFASSSLGYTRQKK